MFISEPPTIGNTAPHDNKPNQKAINKVITKSHSEGNKTNCVQQYIDFFIYLLFQYYFLSDKYLFYNGTWNKMKKRFRCDCYHMMAEIDELITEFGQEGYNIAYDFMVRLKVSCDEE